MKKFNFFCRMGLFLAGWYSKAAQNQSVKTPRPEVKINLAKGWRQTIHGRQLSITFPPFPANYASKLSSCTCDLWAHLTYIVSNCQQLKVTFPLQHLKAQKWLILPFIPCSKYFFLHRDYNLCLVSHISWLFVQIAVFIWEN